jgi:cell division protein ZapA (FtsZ GTPase activity inhibitor)
VQYHEVKVGGQTLRVAHERGVEYINAVAAYVEQKLQARAEANQAPVTMRLVIMAALEIADELFTQGAVTGRVQDRSLPLQ